MLHHCPIPPHTTLSPPLGPLVPRQEEIPGACLTEALCPLEITRLKRLLLCLFYPALPSPLPHYMMDLGGPQA